MIICVTVDRPSSMVGSKVFIELLKRRSMMVKYKSRHRLQKSKFNYSLVFQKDIRSKMCHLTTLYFKVGERVL